MSHFDNEPGAGSDALTPFEFALAGVTPAGAQSPPSHQVIEDMRALLDTADDVPVAHAGLADFLAAGGLVARRHERRRRTRTAASRAGSGYLAAANGTFIDITPADVANSAGAEAEPVDGDAVGAVDAIVSPGAEPDAEAEESASIDVVQAELQSMLEQSETVDHMPPSDPAGADADHLVTGPIARDLLDHLATGPMAASAPPAEPVAGDDQAASTPAEVMASTTDSLRNQTGRFGPMSGPDLETELPPGHADITSETELPVGILAAAGAADLGPFDVAPDAGPPMAAMPLHLPEPITGIIRRPRGTTLALLAAGAAAAVMVAGSLWWATSSSTSSTEAADGSESEVAAAPSTIQGDVAAGSASETADGSTGDDGAESGEFRSESSSSSASSTATTNSLRSTGSQSDGRTSTTVRVQTTTTRSTATTAASTDEASTTTVEVSTTEGSETSTTSTQATTTTARSTTTTPATTRQTTTTQPATTAAPARPVYIGDQVSIGDYDGDGLAGVTVSLYEDEDRDGSADRLVSSTTTDGNGRYSFEFPPACYEVRFQAPAGYRVRSDLIRQYLCLGSGAVAARTDAIVDVLEPAPPSRCVVEQAGRFAGLGVEIYENEGNWAPSYTFYSRSGTVVVRTRNLGPYDTDAGESDREWFGRENGFDHRSVYSVAAERNGVESSRRSCTRN